MKGHSEITDEAAIALVKAYYQHELQLVQSDERTQNNDGWKRVRETWNIITEQLNIQFNLNIKMEQWKKKISNIKTNVKTKQNMRKLDKKANWAPAEIEYERLFSRDLCIPSNNECLTIQTSINNLDLPTEIKNNNFEVSAAESTMEKFNYDQKMRGSKRKLTTYNNDVFVDRSHSNITPETAVASFLTINPINSFIESFNYMSSLSQVRQKNTLFDSSKEFTNNNQSELELKELQIKAAKAQFEAANIQKRASEKFIATIDRWSDAITKFELYMDRIENYMPKNIIKLSNNNNESDANILKISNKLSTENLY